ncbi:hypothetical protein BACFRA24663_24410 [Bacteroides fragilis]
MPGPKYVVTCILDCDDGIALLDRKAVHFERDIAAIGPGVVFYIRNQVHHILPNQFGFSRCTSIIISDVWIGDPRPGMIDEITQNIASGIACLIGRLVG